jgi:Ca2+-binding RTX toxin-like protein
LGSDVMIGGTGNNTYVETPGPAVSTDVIIDSGGNDTIDFSGASRGVQFDLNLTAGQVQVVDSAGNRVAVTGTLENAIGTQFDDNLTGNAVANFLSGLGGKDQLVGQAGRDLLIGGLGADRIIGSAGEDLVIAGRCAFETQDAALRAIVAEWSQSAAVTHLRDGTLTLADGTPIVLLRNSTVLFPATVFDDFAVDQITASNGPDWIFFDNKDKVTDLDPSQDVINDGPTP